MWTNVYHPRDNRNDVAFAPDSRKKGPDFFSWCARSRYNQSQADSRAWWTDISQQYRKVQLIGMQFSWLESMLKPAPSKIQSRLCFALYYIFPLSRKRIKSTFVHLYGRTTHTTMVAMIQVICSGGKDRASERATFLRLQRFISRKRRITSRYIFLALKPIYSMGIPAGSQMD